MTTFDAQLAAAVAARAGDPDWLRQRREEAAATFASLPQPDSSRDEDWRRTDARQFQYERATLPDGAGSARLPASVGALLGGGQATALAYHDGRLALRRVPADLEQRGVIVQGLGQAAREHADLVQAYLGQAVPAGYKKFVALNSLAWSGGSLIYVPAGVEVEEPVQTLASLGRPDELSLPRSLVVVDRGASLTLVEQLASPDGVPGMSSAVSEIYVCSEARLRYISLQRWGDATTHHEARRVLIENGASVEFIVVALGSRVSKSYVDLVLEGPESSADISGVLFPTGGQHLDHQTLQDHEAPHTESNLYLKAALKGEARSVFNGLIRIPRVAQQSNSFMEMRNLLLSPRAKADAIPGLEIEANDVRCSHAVAVGKVEEQDLFYLECRGLDRVEAERLLITAFFQPVMEKIPVVGVREQIERVIEARTNAPALGAGRAA